MSDDLMYLDIFFNDKLLKDKGSLCEKVSALQRRLESQQQVHEHKLQTEIQRVKETALAGEKIRRERWVRENTKKIKVRYLHTLHTLHTLRHTLNLISFL